MTSEQTYAVLHTLLFKLLVYDERKDREYAYKRAVKLLKEIKKDHEEIQGILDDVIKRATQLANRNAALTNQIKADEAIMDNYEFWMNELDKNSIKKWGIR